VVPQEQWLAVVVSGWRLLAANCRFSSARGFSMGPTRGGINQASAIEASHQQLATASMTRRTSPEPLPASRRVLDRRPG